MKTKGIPFWEQQLEYIVIGVAALVFVAIIAMQFIGNPNAVEIAQMGSVGPAEVDHLLENNARALSDELSPSAKSPYDALNDPVPVASAFEQLKTSAVSPVSVLALNSPQLNPLPSATAQPTGTLFAVAVVPPPTELAYGQYFDALTDPAVDANEALKENFPKKPYDVTWTTIGARFDMAAVLSQFKKSGANGEAAIPSSWHNDRVDVIDVKLEREEYVDGNWANPTLINPLPGLYTLRPTLAEKIDAPLRNAILAQIANPTVRSQITQPEFFETKGDSWHPPEKAGGAGVIGAVVPGNAAAPALTDPVQVQIQELQESLAAKKRQRERIDAKIKENNCPPEQVAPPSDSKTKGGKGASIPDQPRGGDRGVGSPAQTETVNLVECANLRKRIKGLDKTIKAIEEELEKLQPNAPAPEQPEPEVPDAKVVQVMPDVIDVWAHDMTVVPGRTYRYRLVVEVYNPLFAKKVDLPHEQESLAEQFTLKSAASEWTEPIHIQPWLQVFVVEATAANGGGAVGTAFGQARAEVFRFSDGRWWSERFPVQPGDRIGLGGGSKTGKQAAGPAIDFATDWFVLDVIENIDADKAAAQRGWGASVILQSVSDSHNTQVRNPQTEVASRELKRLRELVSLSNITQVAANPPG